MLFVGLLLLLLSPHLSPGVHALRVFTVPMVRVPSLHERLAQDSAEQCNLNPTNPQVLTRHASAPRIKRHATRATYRLNQQHITDYAMHMASHLTQTPLPPFDTPLAQSTIKSFSRYTGANEGSTKADVLQLLTYETALIEYKRNHHHHHRRQRIRPT